MPLSILIALAVGGSSPPALEPLLGEWRSVSPQDSTVLQPIQRLVVTPGLLHIDGYAETIRRVSRAGQYIAIQTGIRAVHTFRIEDDNRICSVVLGNLGPAPRVTRFGDAEPRGTKIACFERVEH